MGPFSEESADGLDGDRTADAARFTVTTDGRNELDLRGFPIT